MRVFLLAVDKPPYSAAVRPCLALVRKFWPGFCGWPLSVVWNERSVDLGPDAALILTGPDTHWGRMLSTALAQVEDEWVMIWLDDYFALRAFDSEKLTRIAARIAEIPTASYLRLVPCPPPNVLDQPPWPWPDSEVGEHIAGAAYRFSLQPCFVRRRYLMLRCAAYRDPWAFELQENGDPNVGHYSLDGREGPIHFTQALRKGGEWQREALDLCRREGIRCPDPL